jgi:tRNA (cmo5U34)-methyltransferase
MTSAPNSEIDDWNEEDSESFIEWGDYFVPRRSDHYRIVPALLPHDSSGWVVDICCGAGGLAGSVLEALPSVRVLGVDRSDRMLEAAQKSLAQFEDRFVVRKIELEDRGWRSELPKPLLGAVSSLAIHHLLHDDKRVLFADVRDALVPGGAFLVIDLVEPLRPETRALAARRWDEEVQRQSREGLGSLAAFEVFDERDGNYFRDPNPDEIDRPAPLVDQLEWLREAGFVDVGVFWTDAGHALFGGWRRS